MARVYSLAQDAVDGTLRVCRPHLKTPLTAVPQEFTETKLH
jgi:hypothetical protein